MNKVTELLDAVAQVITCVRNLADSLQVVADVLTDMKSVEVIEAQPVAQILLTKITMMQEVIL